MGIDFSAINSNKLLFYLPGLIFLNIVSVMLAISPMLDMEDNRLELKP